jgi:hypothetical protein
LFRIRRWLGFFAAALIVLTLAGLLGGCATTVEYGTLPPTSKLKQLTPGVTSSSDVIRILGEPQGKGVLHLAGHAGQRTIWSYEYTRAEGAKVQLKILMVLLDGNVYDGHLWFSSVAMIEEGR